MYNLVDRFKRNAQISFEKSIAKFSTENWEQGK